MWQCDCGAVFYEPIRRAWFEHHCEGVCEPFVVYACPECGSESIREIEEDADVS